MANDAFHAQIGAACLFGGGALLIGVLKLVGADGSGASPFVSMGAIVLLFGGPLRWWMRQRWLQSVAQGGSDAANQILAGPARAVWAWWLWLTPDGRKRE
jgi:hypothetical protein